MKAQNYQKILNCRQNNAFFVVVLFCLFSIVPLVAQNSATLGDSIREPLKGEVEYLQNILHEQSWALEVTTLLGPRGTIPFTKSCTMVMTGGTVTTSLPYIGELNSPNLSRETIGIQFHNKYSDYTIKNSKKSYVVSFNVKEIGENYKIRLVIKPNGYTSIMITSNARSDIQYMANIYRLPKDKKKLNELTQPPVGSPAPVLEPVERINKRTF